MPSRVWSNALALAQPQMDATHREFVDLLAAVEPALDHEPDRVAPEHCHAFQHPPVLDLLREVNGVIGQTGDAQLLRRLVAELAAWFPAHAPTMDGALAETMAACGFDAASGTLARPRAAEAVPITGCGSSGCG